MMKERVKSNKEVYAEIMEEALMRVTDFQLKPEIAVKVAWKISDKLDFNDKLLMHQSPTSRAEFFVTLIKDKHFIGGKNNFKNK